MVGEGQETYKHTTLLETFPSVSGRQMETEAESDRYSETYSVPERISEPKGKTFNFCQTKREIPGKGRVRKTQRSSQPPIVPDPRHLILFLELRVHLTPDRTETGGLCGTSKGPGHRTKRTVKRGEEGVFERPGLLLRSAIHHGLRVLGRSEAPETHFPPSPFNPRKDSRLPGSPEGRTGTGT